MPVNSFDDYPMSWRPSLERRGAPIHLELARLLEDDIRSGRLLPGTRLPPQRELADFLDINLSTVSRAFKLCSQKGLIAGSVGSGTYIAYSSLTKLTSSPERGSICLSSMTPETLAQDELCRLLGEMLAGPDCAQFFQYSLSVDEWQLDAARLLLRRAGCAAQPESILISGGGQNAISAVLAGLFSAGDKIGVDPLVYPGMISAAKLFGVQLVPIAQENGEMSEAGIRYAVKNEGVRALYVVPEYQNPTSHIMSTDCRHMIADLSRELGLTLIEDGICSLLSDSRASIYSLAPENSIFILSLSKTVSPALRLAYIACAPRLREALSDALYNINLSPSALMLELSSRLIVSGRIGELLRRRAAGIETRNAIVDSILGPQLGGDSHSLCRWLELPEGMSGAEFEGRCRERGISVYGSQRFGVGKERPRGAARLAVCSPSSCAELEEALLIIRDIIG